MTKSSCAAEEGVFLADIEPESDEREAWIFLYYDERKDAFEAAKAADLLGLRWRLARDGETDEFLEPQWVLEIFAEHVLPPAASASISRDVS